MAKLNMSDYPHLLREWDYEKNVANPVSDRFSGRSRIWWQCSSGHSWDAVLTNRINGSGCPYCAGQKVLKGFNDIFTVRPELEKIWDFEKNEELKILPYVLGVGSSKKVWWKCSKHPHSFESSPASIIRGRSCPYCANKKVLIGFNDFASQVSTELLSEWDYEKNSVMPQEITSGSDKLIHWVCKNGHSYSMTAYRRTGDNRGCSVCAGKIIIAGVNDFASHYPELAKLWDDEKNDTTPDKISYGSSKKRFWIGECGHSFEKSPKMMSKSTGCPYCSTTNKKVFSGFNDLQTMNSKFISNAEQELIDYVISLGFSPVRDRTVLEGKELDIYIPEKSFAIEYNGLYWHSEDAGKDRNYHLSKWQMAKNKNVQLMTIWEDDYLSSPELIKRMIAHKLGVSSAKIYARNTVCKEIDKDTVREFLNNNHLQGFFGAAKHYGLFEKRTDELVSVMSVRYLSKDDKLEISRFASSVNVIGGFSKLLKNIKESESYADVGSVISYSHNDHSFGDVYEKNGFTKIHDGKPSYFYLVDGRRVHRLNFTKDKFKNNPDLLYEDGLTESELAELNGLNKIWDCGSSLWVKQY